MTYFLLAALFLVTLVAPKLGLDLSLATGLSVKNLLLYGISIGVLLETAIWRNRHVELPDVIVPLAALVAYSLLSWVVLVLVVDYERYDWRESLVVLKATVGDSLVVFLVYFYGLRTAESAISLLRWMTSVILVGNIISVLYGLNLVDVGLATMATDGSLEGVLDNRNEYGALVALFLPAVVALYASGSGWLRMLALFGVFASALALFMAGSRGALVGAIIGVLAGCVVLRRYISPLRFVKFAVFGSALIVVGLVILFTTGFGDMLLGRLVGQSAGTAAYISSGRTEIWGQALGKMLEHPVTFVTGFGWDMYTSSRWFWASPHNLYLNLLFNTGLIGLTLFVLVAVNLVRRANSAVLLGEREGTSYLVAAVFGLLCIFSAFFFSDMFSIMFYLWAYAGTAMRLGLCNRAIHLAALRASHDGNSGTKGPALPSTVRVR